MKKYLLFFTFITFIFFNSKGQPISGIINIYTHVTAIGANNVTVASSVGFKVGEKVLIIEMQGASIDTTNTTNFGTITSYGNAGNYEFDTINSIADSIISFKTNLSTTFDTSGMVQLISVPVYSNAVVVDTLTCQPWNGITGGVLVFQSTCSLTLNSNIDVSLLGFRGGSYVDGYFGCANYNYHLDFNTNNGGEKGESISEYIASKNGGMGKQANGGGGGNPGNSGGGGGSNFGNGGMGGYEFNACNTTGVQGYGGEALVNGSNKIYMGGGGGGGFADNGEPVTSGGNGGAIAIIITNSFIGNSFSIIDTGQSVVRNASDESAGGGGAGGTVLLSAQNYISPVTVNTKGGYGGSTYNNLFPTYCHGTGGGASGGLLWINGSSLSPSITYISNGGKAGLVLNPESSCYNTTFYATDGDSGGVIFNLPYNERTYKRVDIGNDTTLCFGQSIQLNAGSDYKSYLWQNNTTDSVLVATTTDKYYVTVTDSNSCISKDTVEITVLPYHVITVLPNPAVICTKQPITLQVKGGSSYQWVGTNDTTDTLTVNPVKDTSYEIIVNYGNCSRDTFVSVAVNNQEPLVIQPPAPFICSGQPLTLSVPVSGTNYAWSPSTGLNKTTGDSVVIINPMVTTTYIVTGLDSLGCAVSDSDIITVIPAPNKPTITISVTGDSLISSASSYNQWNFNNQPIKDSTRNVFIIKNHAKGSYTVTVTNPANGCTTTSDSTTSINQLRTIDDQVSIYPNPFNSSLLITFKDPSILGNNTEFVLYNVLGQLVCRSQINTPQVIINRDGLSQGIYFYQITNTNGIIDAGKLVAQ